MGKVGIVGLGYVGLSSAVCFAMRMPIIGLDIDGVKVASLRAGSTAIHEERLQYLLRSALKSRRLILTTDYEDLKDSEFLFLTVGTPSLESGGIDLSQVQAATNALAPVIRNSHHFPMVVIRSTVVPGTTRELVRSLEGLSGEKAGTDFGVCYNPEFLREGSAIHDTLAPDRIVIGSEDPRSARALKGFYRRLHGKSVPPFVEVGLDTAELVKYASNAFLATKVSFINLMARICEKLPKSDIDEVARSMGLDPRIGGRSLEAGPGFGGSCLPKDIRALKDYANRMGVDISLLRAIDQINETQPGHALSLAEKHLGSLEGKTVAVLGVSFKPGTNDVRESRTITLVDLLARKGARPRVYDPKAMDEARRVLGPRVEYCRTALECILGTDLVVIMNSEPEFRRLKPRDFLKLMRRPAVLDTRRIYEENEFRDKVPVFYVGRSPRVQ